MHNELESILANAYLKYKGQKGGFLKFDHSQCEESPQNEIELFWIDYDTIYEQGFLDLHQFTNFIVDHIDKGWPEALVMFELKDDENEEAVMEVIGCVLVNRLEKYWLENN